MAKYVHHHGDGNLLLVGATHPERSSTIVAMFCRCSKNENALATTTFKCAMLLSVGKGLVKCSYVYKLYVRICLTIFVCKWIYIYSFVNVYICMYMYVCVFIYICMHMYRKYIVSIYTHIIYIYTQYIYIYTLYIHMHYIYTLHVYIYHMYIYIQ